MKHEGSSFLCGYAVNSQLLLCAKERDDNMDAGLALSNFFVMNQDQWGILPETAPWAAQSVAVLEPQPGARRLLVGVGPRGDTWEAMTKPYQGGLQAISPEGPVLARNLSVIDNAIYAVGMGRTVHRRDYDGTAWVPVGPADPLPPDGVVGFNDLAGRSADEMYAVGWNGEIQLCQAGRWTALDSPVSDHLRSASSAPDGSLYAVGYNGAMVHGRGERWRIVDTGRFENLMDVCCHGGEVYVCTDFALLKLRDEGLVAEDRFADPEDVPGTCLHLIGAPDGLFSMGPKDLFRLTAQGWERVV